jgi:type VI protein secretion system component VasK
MIALKLFLAGIALILWLIAGYFLFLKAYPAFILSVGQKRRQAVREFERKYHQETDENKRGELEAKQPEYMFWLSRAKGMMYLAAVPIVLWFVVLYAEACSKS